MAQRDPERNAQGDDGLRPAWAASRAPKSPVPEMWEAIAALGSVVLFRSSPKFRLTAAVRLRLPSQGRHVCHSLHAVRAGLSARRGRWCRRGIYDNMKTAVETVFVGKGRVYNRRFLQMRSHYLVDPVACTPASGWEKGQVENQVGLVRERFFTPRLRLKSYDEMNAWLLDKCLAMPRRITIRS